MILDIVKNYIHGYCHLSRSPQSSLSEKVRRLSGLMKRVGYYSSGKARSVKSGDADESD